MIIISFMVPLIAIGLALFLGTHGIYQNYSFFSYNMLAGIIGTFLALVMGAIVHHKFWDITVHYKREITLVVILETIGAIGFPLLPISVVIHFILLMLRENLFAGDTKTFACLAVTNVYFLAFAGIIGLAFHNLAHLDLSYSE